MLHMKHPVFLRTLPLFNARLKRRRSPQTCLRMFQLHEQRSREVDFMFRLVISESATMREDRSIYRLQNRASP